MTKKNNIINLFAAYLISHFLIWTLVPSISNTNLPLDTIEALAWGSNLEWGFDKHPPLSAAIVQIVFYIFGSNDWAYYMLSQIFTITTIIVVWKLSKEFLKKDIYAFISVLMLSGIYFLNFTTPEFNVNVCQLPFWSLTVLYSWKSFNEKKIYNWFLFGLFASLGFLSKYLFLFLIIAIIFYYINNLKDYKKFDPEIFISIMVFLILISPHIYWLFQNNFSSIQYGLDRTNLREQGLINHFKNPLIFLIKQIIILLPVLIYSVILIKKKKIFLNRKDKKLNFLLSINLIPFAVMLIISFVSGANIRTMWMTPFYLFLPLLIIYYYKKNINLNNIKNFFVTVLFLFLLSPIIYFSISSFDKTKRTDYPGREIADLVQRKWNQNFQNEISVVVGDEWVAGNLSYHLGSRPKWFKSLNNLENFKEVGGVIYAGNPKILKEICPGEYGTIRPTGFCMIGRR